MCRWRGLLWTGPGQRGSQGPGKCPTKRAFDLRVRGGIRSAAAPSRHAATSRPATAGSWGCVGDGVPPRVARGASGNTHTRTRTHTHTHTRARARITPFPAAQLRPRGFLRGVRYQMGLWAVLRDRPSPGVCMLRVPAEQQFHQVLHAVGRSPGRCLASPLRAARFRPPVASGCRHPSAGRGGRCSAACWGFWAPVVQGDPIINFSAFSTSIFAGKAHAPKHKANT